MYLIKSSAIYNLTGGKEREFLSPFAEELFQQDSKSWEHESWKYKDNPAETQEGMVTRSMLWGGGGKIKPPVRVKVNYVCCAKDRLYYVLEMANSSGLFYYDLARDTEMRLFHKADFRPRGLFICEDYSTLTTVSNTDGTVHLVAFDPDGKREEALTSGDCMDENPFQKDGVIYYQSSGIARAEDGNIVATAPSTINTLNRKTGEVETILASEKYDYLLPKVAGDGTLYCIQTPYRKMGGYPLKNRLLDILLFPWRLCVAIFAFLNVFSVFFAKKPLTTAGGPDTRRVEISRRILHNRVVNLQETMKKEGKKVAVSKDWKLVRYSGGETSVIASNVLWFEVEERGGLLFTDGYSIFDASGAKQFEFDDLISGLALAPN